MIWAVVCLGMAASFAYFWPSARVGPKTGPLQYFLLRWGHAAVWVLLAAAVLLRAQIGVDGGFAGDMLPPILGLVAVGVYIAFLAALLRR